MESRDLIALPRDIKVLLVDDDGDMRLLARSALELDGGFDIVGEGTNGAEAIVLAGRNQPDVVLLDLEMPWLDGAEAVPYIRSAAPDALIALWTVAPGSARAEEALALGACVVLDKMLFGAEMLASRLRALLHVSPEERRLVGAAVQ